MSKLKKVLAIVLAQAIFAGAIVAGTVAYLKHEDGAVNVMTVGDVKIDQIEQEYDANGQLQPFTQEKPILPAVYTGDELPLTGTDEAWKAVSGNENVIDKFVTVKNTGVSDAYIRTIIAYEGYEKTGPIDGQNGQIHVVDNGDSYTEIAKIGITEIEGTKYTVYTYTYPNVLKSGETSVPSLKQVYVDKMADDILEAYGEKYNILVLSQAVQAAGFTNAENALNTAFGTVTADKAAEWLKVLVAPPAAPRVPVAVASAAELKAALEAGSDVELTQSFSIDTELDIKGIGSTVLDMKGYTITLDAPLNWKSGDLTITGEGTWKGTANLVVGDASVTVESGTFDFTYVAEAKAHASITSGSENAKLTFKGGTFKYLVHFKNGTLTVDDGYFAGGLAVTDYTNGTSATAAVNGGTFKGSLQGNTKAYTVKGGTFYSKPSSASIADGYTVVQGQDANYMPVYTVTAE